MTFLWILLAIVYVACWVYFGLATFRKGHYWMFWIGFFLPFLWIIGALIAPTEHAAARGAGAAQGASPRREHPNPWRAHDYDHIQDPPPRGQVQQEPGGVPQDGDSSSPASIGGRANRARQGGAG
jgi:hypothetical protein